MEYHFRTRGLNGLIRHQIRLKFQLSPLLQKFTNRLWSAVLSYRAVKWPNRMPIILCRQTTSAYSANTDSYLKDTTDFITKVPSNAILIKTDATSLYTNIPQEEGITLVCQACETFHDKNPLTATHYLRQMLSLVLKENSFHFNGKNLSPNTRNSHGH